MLNNGDGFKIYRTNRYNLLKSMYIWNINPLIYN